MLIEYIHTTSCGMGSNIRRLAPILNLLERKGYNISVRTTHTNKYGDIMQFFDPVTYDSLPVKTYNKWKVSYKLPTIQKREIDISETVRRHFYPKTEIITPILEIISTENPISIHLRRGDAHAQVAWMPTKFTAKMLSNKYPDRKIFICSDSQLAASNLQKELPNSFVSESIKYPIGGSSWKGIHRSGIGSSYERGIGIVSDIYMLALSEERWTQGSSIDHVCRMISPGQIVNIIDADYDKVFLKNIMIMQKHLIYLNKKSKFSMLMPMINYIEHLCDSCSTPEEYFDEMFKISNKLTYKYQKAIFTALGCHKPENKPAN